MKKDKTTSIRLNSEVYEILKKKGLTPQKIFDDAIKQLVEVKTNVKFKGKR
jgi:predicted DNA-binding protein